MSHIRLPVLACFLLMSRGLASGENLIYNGDFEDGNAGFYSSYGNYTSDSSPNRLDGQTRYIVAYTPQDGHPDWPLYGDHTTGSGLMMMANGARTPVPLWGQSGIAVSPGTEYTFSYYLASWNSVSPAQIETQINGQVLGIASGPSAVPGWFEVSYKWNSRTNIWATIELRDINTALVGNDIMIDDISLSRGAAAVTLTISSTTGGHVVNPGEGTFNCPAGTSVSIAAAADAGYRFVNWTGTAVSAGKVGDPASASTNVTVTADYNLVANFALDTGPGGKHVLTVVAGDGGSIVSPGEGAFEYEKGTKVSIGAEAKSRFVFTGWTGTAVSAGKVENPGSAFTTVLVSADYTVVANFQPDTAVLKRVLTVSCGPGGSVSTPGEGRFEYDDGSSVILVAQPDPGYRFARWSGGIYDTSNPLTIQMDGNLSIRATFESIVITPPVITPPKPVLQLSGKVRSSRNRAALGGVQVTAGGQSTTTNGEGYYSFSSLSPTQNLKLNASKSGYTPYAADLKIAAGMTSFVHDFEMFPVASGKPVITRLTGKYDVGMFLAGIPVNNEYTAQVQWNGAPGTLEFYANSTLKTTVGGTSTGGKASFNMGKDFPGSLGSNANKVRVRAKNAEGGVSDWFEKSVTVLPLPEAVAKLLPWLSVQATDSKVHVLVDFDIPQTPIEKKIILPLIGEYGLAFAANGSFDYTVTDGDWEVAFGVGAEGKEGKRGRRPLIPGLTRYPKLKLYLGNKEISGHIKGGRRGTATVGKGVTSDEVFASAGIGAKLELGRVGVPDLVLAGATTALSKIPGLKKALLPLSVIIYVQPEFDGEVTFHLKPQFAFDRVEMDGDVAIEASYAPDLGICKMRLYVGGGLGGTIQYPGDLLKEVRLRAYAGAEFTTWLLTLGPYEVVWETKYPSSKGAKTYVLLEVPHVNVLDPEMRPINRAYLQDGLAKFVAHMEIPLDARASSPEWNTYFSAAAAMEAFRSMPITSADTGMLRIAGEPASTPVQVDLALIENVFPDSEPVLAGNDRNLMLVYVSDNGASGDLQFTDINWTWFDGINWTEPAAIVQDTRAEFAPQVAFDGHGNAVAVWERVKDTDFNTVDIEAMASQMEIVSATWNPSSQQWSQPVPFTANEWLDHKPLLCGPMSDGSMIAVWTQNTGNRLIGDEDFSDDVFGSTWDPATRTWGIPQRFLRGVSYRQSQSLSGAGSLAVYAWTCDMDGDLSTTEDQELFTCSWNGQVWTAPRRVTDDMMSDRDVRVAVSGQDGVYLVWQRGEDLVWDRDFSGISLVREDSQTVAFSDYVMTLGPNGNLVLLWTEQSDTGADTFYRVYDPAAERWSQDSRIFADSSLERSLSPIWDSAGNLTVAYNRVQISKTSKLLELSDGEVIEVNNIPMPGRVDLSVFKRRLATDLGFEAGDFTADGNDYLPGDDVLMKATVRNTGNLSVNSAVVAFYDGDPADGGTEIGRQAIPGWLEGGAAAEVQMVWRVPSPAKPYKIRAVLDPDQQVLEVDEGNNELSLSLGGTDLTVALISADAGLAGSARVIIEVANRGAPEAPETSLAVWNADQPGAVIHTVAVPRLVPGGVTQVALELPAGTLPFGDTRLLVIVDDANAVSDIDPENNRVTFPLSRQETTVSTLSEPMAMWSFDDGAGMTASDSAGEHDATVVGASWIQGILSGALQFDGSDDYVDCGAISDLAPKNLTISLWIQAESSEKGGYLVGKTSSMGYDRDYTLAMQSDATVEFFFGEAFESNVRFRTQNAVMAGEWTHLAATRDGSRACLYLNGKQDASVEYSFASSDKGQSLKIGAYSFGPWGFFKGAIDDVRVYNTALNGTEVQSLYDQSIQ